MQILNLTNPLLGDIKYDIIIFPDGEVQIELGEFSRKEEVHIITRINSMNSLFLLMQVCDILRRHEVDFVITIVYLMTMRMDRVMNFNRPFSLKIIAEIINKLGAERIFLLEPHSDKSSTLISKSIPYRPSFFDIHELHNKYTLVFPDEGACKRYSCGYTDVITCSKVRDVNTGKLISFEVNNKELVTNATKSLMILDDLCDGGGTFCGIASKIKELNPNVELNLTVTHMVNAKGIENTSKIFNKVYITDSYRDWDDLPDNVIMQSVF